MVSFSTSLLFAITLLPSLASSMPVVPPFKVPACSLSGSKPNMAGTVLSVPSGNPLFVALGVGTQNYTCGQDGTPTSAGAVATLYDISCLDCAGSSQNTVLDVISGAGDDPMMRGLVRQMLSSMTLGKHYFVPNPAAKGTGISPKFDFTMDAKRGDSSGYVVAKKVANATSPDGKDNIDWLSLENVGPPGGGNLAMDILRVHTRGGQPPASCTAGDTTAVPYTAQYWFY